MVEIVALVIVGYVLFTIGVGTLIGKGHRPATALRVALPSVVHHRLVRDLAADLDLLADWDTRSDVARSDGVAWDLVA
jgi:hypothetical protein